MLTYGASACGWILAAWNATRKVFSEMKLKDRQKSYCKVAERDIDYVSMTFLRCIPYLESFKHVCIDKESGTEIILCTEAKS